MSGTRVHLKTLGCRLNEAELETWAREFRARGWGPTSEPDRADLVVVNTCAVTEEAARKSRQLVRRSQRTNPQAKLVLSGCYATLDGERARADLGVDLLVANADKDRLVEIALEELDFAVMPAQSLESHASPWLRAGRQRAFIKVQDGCRYRCTYCIVTVARGAERSRAPTDVVAEINGLHASGVQEVVLTGVHLGGYGSDRGTDLGRLIDTILSDTAIARVRIGSLEPWDLPRDFWRRFDNPRLMPHLHLPLQSGSDAVLRRMSRRCRGVEFRSLVDTARKAVPDLNITTEIIVGFPGETAAEWQETLAFVDAVRFGHIHIFAFSPRSGTKAANMPDQLERQVKRERSEQLHQLAARHKTDYLSRFIGRTLGVLIENQSGSTTGRPTWSGYTPNYLRARMSAPGGIALENRLLNLVILALDESGEGLIAGPEQARETWR